MKKTIRKSRVLVLTGLLLWSCQGEPPQKTEEVIRPVRTELYRLSKALLMASSNRPTSSIRVHSGGQIRSTLR